MGAILWFTHMKTTVEIAPALLKSARETAAREGTTLRELIEEGLRAALDRRRQRRGKFRLRDASFRGDGLQPGVDLGNWEQVRAMIYEDAGP
jgi:hypothetical protein